MAQLLSMDKDMAASFLNSVLNQLNWAFSEFIGMIQEVGHTHVMMKLCDRPFTACTCIYVYILNFYTLHLMNAQPCCHFKMMKFEVDFILRF